MLKKHLAFLLSVMILLSVITIVPLAANAANDDLADTGAQQELAETGWSIPTEAEFASRMSQLREKYPSYGYSGVYYEDGYPMAWQCYGYACLMFYEVFGIKYYADGFVNRTDYTMGELNAGDIVRIRGNTHSIFITKVTDNGYYFTDGNWDNNNGVRWDAYYTKAEMAATFSYKIHVPGNNLTGTGTARSGLYAETPVLKEARSSAPGITVYWYPQDDAAAYRVYYKKGDQPRWKTLGDTENNYYQFIDDLEYGAEYSFTVRALDSYDELISSYDTDGVSTVYTVAPPELKTAEADVDKISVSWSGVKSVKNYRVYAKGENDTNWRTVGIVSGNSFSFTKGEARTDYQFTVRCLNNYKKIISGCSAKTVSAEFISYDSQLDTPANINSAPVNKAGTIRTTWDAVDGATYYQVFYKRVGVNAGWKKLAVTTNTYYNHSGIENDSVYRYTVRCIDEKGAFISGYQAGPEVHFYLYPDKMNAVKADDDGNLTVSWNAVQNAPAYALYYKTASTNGWRRIVTDEPITGTSYVFGGCESGETYTFTVRVCEPNGCNLSSFSTTGVSVTY